MKKLLSVVFTALLSIALFTACDSILHQHIEGQWEFNDSQHWQNVTCTWHICNINLVSYDHIDEDKDSFCDVCGYRPLRPSLGMNWHYSDSHHWRLPEGEETFAVVYGYNPHVDEDKNNICDTCGYQYSIDTETDHMQ